MQPADANRCVRGRSSARRRVGRTGSLPSTRRHRSCRSSARVLEPGADHDRPLEYSVDGGRSRAVPRGSVAEFAQPVGAPAFDGAALQERAAVLLPDRSPTMRSRRPMGAGTEVRAGWPGQGTRFAPQHSTLAAAEDRTRVAGVRLPRLWPVALRQPTRQMPLGESPHSCSTRSGPPTGRPAQARRGAACRRAQLRCPLRP